MARFIILMVCGLCFAGTAAAQDTPLVAQDIIVATEQDLYGQQVLYAEGRLANPSSDAYSNVNLEATAFDADGNIIGEGFGYLVNACGAALLPDFVLQPDASQSFAVPLELDDAALTVDHVEINAEGTLTEVASDAIPIPLPGITEVVESEIVSVEWIDAENLRFGAGCYRDIFTDLNWYEYSLSGGTPQAAEHPKAALVREALLRQLGLLDPLYLANSFLTFAPDARRMVYQNEINTIYTAEPDGSFKRQLFNELSNRTLEGITWLDNGNFLAYYYAGYGDPVSYFTANLDGQILSEPPANALPSITVPGGTPNGQRIVIGLEVDGKTGFYLKLAAYPTTQLLFEAEVPGNNWPAPIYELDADGSAFIYAALPVNGEARLTCFNVQTNTLHQLSALPLQLSTDERGWWWLSPDKSTIALAANGVNGGLWTIALDKVADCQ